MKKITLFTLLFSSCLAISFAQPGALDPSFGTNGFVTTSLGVNYNYGGVAKKVLAQSDGSLYVITSGGESPRATRYPNRTRLSVTIKKNPEGSNDLSYGDNGFSRFVSMSANYGAMQQDGKIVMVGSTGNYFAIARYNTDGSLDSTFSDDGIQTTGLGDYAIANSVAIYNDGKIVVAGLAALYNGEAYIDNFAIARFNTDGTLDNTFNGDGRLIENVNNSNSVPHYGRGSVANAVAIQTDGKIVVVGETPNETAIVVRYNADGSRDNDFIENDYVVQDYERANSVVIQSDGTIVVGGGGLHWYNSDGDLVASQSIGGIAQSIALQTDGKIVVAGYTNTGSTSDSADFLTARFNTDGSPDNTFSGDGKQTTNFGKSSNIANSVAIQNDGKLVAAGYTAAAVGRTGKDSKGDFALARYESNGDPDNSFDQDGKLTGAILAANTVYTSTAIQKDGKIVAAGKTWNGNNFDFAIARYNIDGTLDNTFSGDAKQTTDFNAQNDFTNSIAIQNDGKIVIAGSAIIRYNTDGSLDNTFSGDGIQPPGHYIASIAIQSDGKIVAAGYREEEYTRYFALSRYNSDGSLDNTFGEDGTISTQQPSFVTSLAIQRDGKIVAAGGATSGSPEGPSLDFVIFRYNTDGSPDNTFGLDGTVSDETYSNYVANAVAIQSDGTIVVVIESGGLGSDYFGIALVSYDTNGKLVKDLRSGRGDYYIENPASVVIQSDDKIVVAGKSGNNFALVRFNKDLSLDSSFSGDGKQTTGAIQANGGINSIAIANDKLYAVGYSTSSGNYGVVARYVLNEEGQNNAPTVNLTIPYNIVKYSAPARIKLNVAVANVSGKITKVQFFNGTTQLHTEDVAPYGFLWTDVPAGNYTLTAKAFDDSGNAVTSNAINVSVVDENVPPVVSIVSPVDDSTYTGPATIRLIAEAKDPNDKISKVEFYNGSTLLRTEYYYPYTYTWTNVQPGTYTITAIATDDKGLSATSAPVTVTVTNPMAPIVSSRPFSVKQNDLNGTLSLRLSPNPASNILQVSTNGLQQNKPSTISVISASGAVMKTIQSNASNKVVQLDVSSMVSGVYTIKVASGDKVMYKQFVKL